MAAITPVAPSKEDLGPDEPTTEPSLRLGPSVALENPDQEHVGAAFLCHTPLHLLLSRLVLDRCAEGHHSEVVVVNDSSEVAATAAVLFPRRSLHLLPGALDGSNGLERARIRASNCRHIRREFENRSLDIHVFNDTLPEDQALLSLEGARNKICLEDGIALYPVGGSTYHGWLAKMWKPVAFGPRWLPIARIGTHPEISEIRCFHPALVRDDLRHKRLSQIDVDHARVLSIARMFSIEPPAGSPLLAALVPFAPSGAEGARKFVETVTTFAKREGLPVAYKLHPRDASAIRWIKAMVPNACFLPAPLPIELIAATMPQIAIVVGMRTSALHVTKCLNPLLDCRYFEDGRGDSSREWTSFFGAVNVRPLFHGTSPNE